MIINASRDNPVILEFSYAEETVDTYKNATSAPLYSEPSEKLYYGGIAGVFRKTNSAFRNDVTELNNADSVRTIGANEFAVISNDVTQKKSMVNALQKNKLAVWINYIQKNKITTLNTGLSKSNPTAADYGLVNSPTNTATYTSGALWASHPNNTDYVIMSEVSGMVIGGKTVNNHCGATSATNMLMYYARYLITNAFIVNEDRIDTFSRVYGYIGNGPVLPGTYRNKLVEYFDDHVNGYSISTGNLSSISFATAKSYVNNNIMLYMVSWPQLFSAHYINIVGYRDYSTGDDYVRVMDNWNDTTERWVNIENSPIQYMGYVNIYSS